MYKPSRDKITKPEETLRKYVQHNGSKASKQKKKQPIRHPERDELILEQKDGLSHEQRARQSQQTVAREEQDETILSGILT